MKQKLIAWFAAFALCMTSMSTPGHTEDTKHAAAEEMTDGTAVKITETSDFASFLEAAAEEMSEDSKENPAGTESGNERNAKEKDSVNLWQNRRLLVRSENEFDVLGAESIISGYDNLFILSYASEEETKTAYRFLKKNPKLTVEADVSYETTSVTAETDMSSNEGIESEKIISEGNLSEGGGVIAAVLDTGYDEKSGTKDRVTEGVDLTGKDTVLDENGHGTAMTNIILDHTPECVKVMPVKAADENGKTSALKLYLGICYAVERGAELIHISMSAYKASGSEILEHAVRKAVEKGIFVVVSAGNAKADTKHFSPANLEEAIVVSAVDDRKLASSYSNYGTSVDYCAYGFADVSCLNGEVKKQKGTSVSAAFVSAVIAGRKACKKDLSYGEMMETLNRMAEDLGEEGKDELYGNGLLVPDSLKMPENTETDTAEEGKNEEGKEETNGLLFCDWQRISAEEFNRHIGNATNIERRVFLDKLSEEERNQLLSMNTLFSEEVIYSEHSFDGTGNETELLRREGRLYDILTKGDLADEYEIQAQKYHVFAYGSRTGTRSCIKLDTSANQNDAVIYCWMKDRSSDNQNSGEYGITFAKGSSAFDFGQSTHRIENCDSADSGNAVVWRLKVRNVKVSKPEHYALNYNSALWNKSTFKVTGNQTSGYKAHYWYIFNYQVQPASGASRQRAYADGSYHGGFWDLSDASGKKCGRTELTTTVDIGSRDLYTDENKDGITYRLPLTAHDIASSVRNTVNAEATCLQEGSSYAETTYSCSVCDRTWMKTALLKMSRLAHNYIGKTEENNGIPMGKYWEECSRNCRGSDVNGAFWQRNVKYLHPVHYWEMKTDGRYEEVFTGTDRAGAYYAPGETIPKWIRKPSEEFQTGVIQASLASNQASYQEIYIPRKQYRVVYKGNGARRGVTKPQIVYCGEVFDLRKNGFERDGYWFRGWSKLPDGEVAADKSVKNLSLTHNAEVQRYALWEPGIFQINLDGQGADAETGTKKVFEHYSKGYYADQTIKEPFADNRIQIPEKERTDKQLPGGVRKQQFDGYYTKRRGEGFQMVKPDGSLNADINHAGNYKYFTQNSTVYAKWKDMNIVQFDMNLTKQDMKLIEKDETGTVYDPPVLCPCPRWKGEGEDITVSYGKAVVKHKDFSDLYRFKGWSLEPEIKDDAEIILSEEKPAITFSADEDVTLYAQWELNAVFAFIGNEQSQGMDFQEEALRISDHYVFPKNAFAKTTEKPTMDISSGRMADEKGVPYMETVSYSFQGYSMAKEKEKQGQSDRYYDTDGEIVVGQILLAAKESAKDDLPGLTFGAPASDYGAHSAPSASGAEENLKNEISANEKTPFVSFYAVWDQYPQIQAADLYLPLSDARAGVLTEAYLLNLAEAMDEELKSDANRKGLLKPGKDAAANTSFTIPDYQASDFTDAEHEMRMTITYRAEDAVGNVATKTVSVHLADTSGKEYAAGKVRFISKEHLDTLAENSVWRTGKYAEKLEQVLENQKTGAEYTAVTPLQQAFGVRPVLKPGSGEWERVQEIWEFKNEEIKRIQDYVEQTKMNADPREFLNKFGHCRIR